MTFADLIRLRLLVLIERHDTNPTALALAMGRAKSHLTRKLVRPNTSARAFVVEDVDEILAHLQEPRAVLFAPILLPGDQELLDWIDRKSEDEEVWPTLDAARATFSDVDARIARLAPEGLITVARHPDVGDVFHNPDPSDTRWTVLNPATLAPECAA